MLTFTTLEFQSITTDKFLEIIAYDISLDSILIYASFTWINVNLYSIPITLSHPNVYLGF